MVSSATSSSTKNTSASLFLAAQIPPSKNNINCRCPHPSSNAEFEEEEGMDENVFGHQIFGQKQQKRLAKLNCGQQFNSLALHSSHHWTPSPHWLNRPKVPFNSPNHHCQFHPSAEPNNNFGLFNVDKFHQFGEAEQCSPLFRSPMAYFVPNNDQKLWPPSINDEAPYPLRRVYSANSNQKQQKGNGNDFWGSFGHDSERTTATASSTCSTPNTPLSPKKGAQKLALGFPILASAPKSGGLTMGTPIRERGQMNGPKVIGEKAKNNEQNNHRQSSSIHIENWASSHQQNGQQKERQKQLIRQTVSLDSPSGAENGTNSDDLGHHPQQRQAHLSWPALKANLTVVIERKSFVEKVFGLFKEAAWMAGGGGGGYGGGEFNLKAELFWLKFGIRHSMQTMLNWQVTNYG